MNDSEYISIKYSDLHEPFYLSIVLSIGVIGAYATSRILLLAITAIASVYILIAKKKLPKHSYTTIYVVLFWCVENSKWNDKFISFVQNCICCTCDSPGAFEKSE